MIGLRIAVQTECLAQPLRQALHTVGPLGADGVQINLRTELPAAELSDTALRQLRKLLDDLNLRVGSTAFPTRRGYANPHDLDRRLEATLHAMRATSRMGGHAMVVALGPLPEDGDDATLIEALTQLGAHGNRLGVQLAVQSVASPAELTDLIVKLPEGFLGVNISPADLIHSGRQPLEYVEKLGPHVTHAYANDAVRGVGGGSVDVQLGRGTAELPEMLAKLEEHDYRGWITVERRHSPRPAEEVADAVQYLRSL